jgi:hypothetical protein
MVDFTGPLNTKRCGGPCKKAKFETEFHTNRSRPDGLAPYCKACQKVFRDRYLSRGGYAASVKRQQQIANAKKLQKALDTLAGLATEAGYVVAVSVIEAGSAFSCQLEVPPAAE